MKRLVARISNETVKENDDCPENNFLVQHKTDLLGLIAVSLHFRTLRTHACTHGARPCIINRDVRA